MMPFMTEDSSPAPRKRLRVGHVSERGGVNAVRTLLEAHGLVVDEVDARSDYGRDLIVDITEANAITGAVIGVQVKGDRRFVCDGTWELPVDLKTRRYWAESSVPIIGILWDPDSGELRWGNLTAFARTDPMISDWPPHAPRQEPSAGKIMRFPSSQVLSDETLPDMIEQMHAYVRRTAAPALLGLFDADEQRRCHAVFDCWTLGRTDARAFLLLRHALPSLAGESLRQAIATLSRLTPHPDIFWHDGNWVPPEVERQVRQAFRWSTQEVYELVGAVEHLDDEGAGWERGGLGQCLWMLLAEDPTLPTTVETAMGLAARAEDADTTFRLLVIHQFLAEDPLDAAHTALEQFPLLRGHAYSGELIGLIAEFGRLNVY
jgi:hypothetical protein